jgi:hypothetical protein
MPTHETIANNNVIPQVVEKPIPVRTVSTRTVRPTNPENSGQQPTINSLATADSAAPPAESVRLSAQVSAIARKEQAYRQRELALKEREKAIEARLSDAEKYDQLKTKLSAKDFSEAEALGLSYEDYTQYVIEKQGGENPQEAAIKKLEAKIEALEKGTEESAASQYEETLAEYRKEIGKAVFTNPEYSSIKELEGITGVKGEEAVLQLIVDAFEQDNEELSVADACQQIEDYVIGLGKKFNSLSKLKPQVEAEEVEPQRALPRPMVGKTLTNDMTVGSEKRPQKSLQHLSEAERYAEARRRVLERQNLK